MNAEIKPGYEQKRVNLADRIPLEMPFTLYVTASHICNFRCNYCTQSWSNEEKKKIEFKQQFLEWDTFINIVEQAAEFNGQFKQILFTGLGEPLLNPKTPDMIKIITERNLSEKVEMYTNGYYLDQEMTKRIVDSGLYRLRISIQGVSSEHYKKNCGVDIDFDRLVNQIKYFYENRGNTLLYIKVIDACLEDGEEEKFYEIFGDICDEIYIEHLVKAQPRMGDYNGKVDETLTLYGERVVEKNVCPLPFYILQVDAVGNVFPCTPLTLPVDFSLGNINETTLKEIWYGEKLKKLRMKMLESKRKEISVCDRCESFLCITHDTDNLDRDKNMLLEKIRIM